MVLSKAGKSFLFERVKGNSCGFWITLKESLNRHCPASAPSRS